MNDVQKQQEYVLRRLDESWQAKKRLSLPWRCNARQMTIWSFKWAVPRGHKSTSVRATRCDRRPAQRSAKAILAR